MSTTRKNHASRLVYTSPSQQILPGFEHPFERELDPSNRWVVLSRLIPWDEISGIYHKQVGVSSTGRPGLNPRVAIGTLIIKYLCNLDDRETVEQISEKKTIILLAKIKDTVHTDKHRANAFNN